MMCIWSSVDLVNTLLCIVILILGLSVYKKKKNNLAKSVAIAFGLFAFSHIISLLGWAGGLLGLQIIIRVLAYLILIFALLKIKEA
ncbi:MAG: hypothetical protein PHC54_07340 [Candidatus Omnitrophica bacterium]|nr:hypothetical protein [Candidatus Omnitrophota bacterium]MDD5593093.1 hypothetical protein [Candidatus Omnitrophota bacterium]